MKKHTRTEAAPVGNASVCPTVSNIALSAISVPPASQRERLADDSLAELKASIQQNGLLSPIGVRHVGGATPYELVYGARRLKAVAQLGHTTVACIVIGGDVANHTALRAAENIARRDLNPAEEAVMVAQLLESVALEAAVKAKLHIEPLDKLVTAEDVASMSDEARAFHVDWLLRDREGTRLAVEAAAQLLGKSAGWVRDRMYLGRLDGQARELVLAGRLPLAHAREIAKLADPAMREQIASQAAADEEPGSLPMDLRDLKQIVARNIYSLAQVPWSTKVPFAGQPACETCPHNSRNQEGLFAGGVLASADLDAGRRSWGERIKDEPEAGICTLQSCYKAKTAAVAAEIRKAAKRADEELAPTARVTSATVRKFTPELIDAGAVAAAVKDRRASKAQDDKPEVNKAEFAASLRMRQEAERRAREALIDRQRAILEAIDSKMTPTRLAALHLAMVSNQWPQRNNWGPQRKRNNAVESRLVRAIVDQDLEALVKGCTFEKPSEIDDYLVEPTMMEHLAKQLGCTMPAAAPTFDQLMRELKAAAAKPAGEEPAASPKKSTPKTRKRVERSADESDDVPAGPMVSDGEDDEA